MEHKHVWMMPNTHYRQCWFCGLIIEGEEAWNLFQEETRKLIEEIEKRGL